MLSINMNSLWSDETDLIIQGIQEATNNIIAYYNAHERSPDMLLELGNDICDVCNFWSGKTYVGVPKKDDVQNAFQSFFEALMNLLLDMKYSKKDYETNIANAMLYRGTVYRYLGNDRPNQKVIIPIYNEVYVSWSKYSESDYILNKLYEPITWMSCEITTPLYGIDLDVIGCSRAHEKEVVFPTIEQHITEIKYISKEESYD